MSPRPILIVLVAVFKILCAIAIWFAVLWTSYLLGPAIETHYHPAVSKLTIIEMKDDGHGRTLMRTEFTKLRDCEFVGIAWFRGSPDGTFERVPVVLIREPGDNSSPNRPLGRQRSGPWEIGMLPDEIRGNSFAKLWHRCHIFWLTETDFYP